MSAAAAKGADAFAAHRKAARAAVDAIEAARVAVYRLRDQRAHVEAAALPQADALAALDAGLDAMAEQARRSLSVTSLTRPAGRPSLTLPNAASDLLPLIVAVCRTEMRKIVAEKIAAAYRPGSPSLTREQRDQRLAEIDAQLLAAEMHEERLIRQAEAVGLTLDRRADADARAVLAAMPEIGAGDADAE